MDIFMHFSRYMDEQIDRLVDGWMDEQIDRQTDKQTDGWMDKQIDRSQE